MGRGKSSALALTSLTVIEHAVFFVVALRSIRIFKAQGVRGVIAATFKALRNLPGVDLCLQKLLQRDVRQAVRHLSKSPSEIRREAQRPILHLPEEGIAAPELLAQLQALKAQVKSVEDDHIFDYVYTNENGDMENHVKTILAAFHSYSEKSGAGKIHDLMLQTAFSAFATENGLNPANPAHLPALRKFETEVCAMVASLFNGDEEVVGSLTCGSTECILLAVKAYRDMAKRNRPDINDPEMVVPTTVHPAFEKAAAYFGVRTVHVPVGPDARVELDAFEAAITSNTILLVASAPQYPHGVIDPIPSLAELALEHDLPLHVDACFGGFMLPFLERLGYDITTWDFRCEGVTSISADLHKYGFCLKGAGVILYRTEEIREHQFFTYVDWPGGIFGSPSIVGTRPGGHVASAWAALMSMGENGYLMRARVAMEVTDKLKKGVRSIPGLGLVADSEMTCLAICSRDDDLNVLTVGDVMEERGWRMERQQNPPSLHLSVMPHHEEVVDNILMDLRASVSVVRRLGKQAVKNRGSAAIYGVVANLPDRSLLSEFIRKLYGEIYRLAPGQQSTRLQGGLESVLEGEEDEEDDEEEEAQ